MKKICGIYKITSPVNKVYVGQSLNIHSRWMRYKKLHCKGQVYLYNSLKKYGVDKHKFEIIEQCKTDELNEREKYYIKVLNTFNSETGINVRDGGGNHGKLSNETKKKISIAHKGRIVSEETKLKMSKSHLGQSHKMSDISKKKMSEDRIGKPISKKHREKISEALKGRILSEEHKNKIKKSLIGNKNRLSK